MNGTIASIFSTLFASAFDILYVIFIAAFAIVEVVAFPSQSLRRLLALLTSTTFTLLLYSVISQFILTRLAVSRGLSDAMVYLFLLVLFYLLAFSLLGRIISDSSLPKGTVGRILSSIFGFVTAILLALHLTVIFLSFPFSAQLKSAIYSSHIGGALSGLSLRLESPFRLILGERHEQMNFVLVEPLSEEFIDLKLDPTNLQIDTQAGQELALRVNELRIHKGLESLSIVPEIHIVAEEFGAYLFLKGQLFLYSNGNSEAKLALENAGIISEQAFGVVAHVQDPEAGMDYLLENSEISRFLLSEGIERIGVGVVEGGAFGYIIVILVP